MGCWNKLGRISFSVNWSMKVNNLCNLFKLFVLLSHIERLKGVNLFKVRVSIFIVYSRVLLHRELVTQQSVSCSAPAIFKESAIVIYVTENFTKPKKDPVVLPKKIKSWRIEGGPNYFLTINYLCKKLISHVYVAIHKPFCRYMLCTLRPKFGIFLLKMPNWPMLPFSFKFLCKGKRCLSRTHHVVLRGQCQVLSPVITLG